LPELLFLVVIDIRPPALGEPVHEERPGSAAEENDRPVAPGSSLPRSGDSLFDDLARNRLVQRGIRDPFLPGEAFKLTGFIDSHNPLFIL
jgi:hypothetical protein